MILSWKNQMSRRQCLNLRKLLNRKVTLGFIWLNENCSLLKCDNVELKGTVMYLLIAELIMKDN